MSSPFWERTTITDVKLRRDLRPKEVQVLNPLRPTWENWYVHLPTIDSCSESSNYNFQKSQNDFLIIFRNGIRNSLSWLQPTPNSVCTNTTLAETFVSRIPLQLRKQVITIHTALPSIARFRVGQNNYIGGSSADTLGISNWTAAVTAWYNEVKDMNTTYVTSFP
jgi:hypothetical protein